MTGTPRHTLTWSRREPPLDPAAVAATGPAAPLLAAAARERIAAGARLRAAADGHTLLLLGDPADLPWTDGCRYLGWEDGVLVPTTARPWPPATLWRDALAPDRTTLLALLPETALLTPSPPHPLDQDTLTASFPPPEPGDR
ncbi:hypothetical protein [Kitasatospora camelliae]|uniref:MoxR-vWA-beta-propeller ternary system domain-containing protein n=1 Tax=Kitasatospora camelliae TaxID=3156397 RepID=A0AAU8K5Q6_9ACTN